MFISFLSFIQRLVKKTDLEHKLKAISLYNLASLSLLRFLEIQPSVVVTNDWFAGLAAAYKKSNYFNKFFDESKFIHIVHNLADGYQGRIYLDEDYSLDLLSFITGLDTHYLVDPYWEKKIMNPSRCAILASDQWATVSKSYRKEILDGSSLKHLLLQHPEPFAFPNGVLRYLGRS